MLNNTELVRAQTFVSRANPDKLFSDYPSPNDDGLISAYLAYEFFRHRLDQQFDLDGNVAEHLKLLNWYMTHYFRQRQCQLPLSARQIAFFNTPLPVLDFACDISMLSHSFIRRELGQHINLNDRRAAMEAIYWWCTDCAPSMQFESVLVPDYYIQLLNELEVAQRWLPFHLNFFTTRYYETHPELHFLNMDQKMDRLALLVYIVFQCGSAPHLVRFLPRDAIGRFFSPLPGAPGYIVLDSIIALLPVANVRGETKDPGIFRPSMPVISHGAQLERSNEGLSAARTIRQSLVAAIEAGGYSLRAGRRMTTATTEHFGQCLAAQTQGKWRPVQGVALIGAVSATSGLGQASRMSLKVLEVLTEDLSVRSFDMDNPAPVGYSTENKRAFSDRPRSINLIHLNAEAIPLAFAYLPQSVYRNSYNIGFFFWELNRVPPSQHLGVAMLDEIWVASEYDREIYSQYTDIPVTNVGMAVEAISSVAPLERSYFGLPEDAFIFLTTFDSFSFIERKNPLGVVQAFREAFPLDKQDVVLVVKTQNRFKVNRAHHNKIWAQITQHASADPRIILVNETFNYQDLLAFKQLCNCYVSLHRSEGFGFGMIEAMQLGVPVIATGYSGNMDFCNDATCYLVEYDLIVPQPHEYIFVERDSQWAEPRTASAAVQMRAVEQLRAQVDDRAVAAKAFVQSNFSVDAISLRYGERLAAIGALLGHPPLDESASDSAAETVSAQRKAARKARVVQG